MKGFIKRVAEIQLTLKAPKTQYNKFGDYNYRNLEDILMAVKPILKGLVLTISDDVKLVGNEIYVFSTATLTDGDNSISNTAAARETMVKKKYDSSQLTGSASSYARKYCLNGLFGIDDNKDSDYDAPSADDLAWVKAINNGQNISDILDPKYREYIKGLL